MYNHHTINSWKSYNHLMIIVSSCHQHMIILLSSYDHLAIIFITICGWTQTLDFCTWGKHSTTLLLLLGRCLQFEPSFILAVALDKFKQTGQNLGRVFNSRFRRAYKWHKFAQITKQPNLKSKTRPKQLLGSLPLVFALPSVAFGVTKLQKCV